MNALLSNIEYFFTRHRDKLVFIHLLMLVFFVALLSVPLFLADAPEDAIPVSHFTLFANFLIWGLWFPLVFLSVIFTGRSWCGLLCPMGAASEWVNKIGLHGNIPAWVRWEGTPVISFLLVTIWGQTLGVRDHPEALAIVFGSTLLAALVIGFLYGKNKRAWCRHVCPIGLLLGVFARIGMLDFTPKTRKPSAQRYTQKGLCPTLIDISSKDESRHCIECFKCVNPDSKGGLELQFRPPGAELESIRRHNPNRAEIWFLFLATGVVLGGFLWLSHPSYQQFREMVGQWFMAHNGYWIFDSGPHWLMSVHPARREVFSWLDFSTISVYMLGCMVLFTALLALSTTLSTWLARQAGATGKIFTELSYQYMPVAMVSILIGLGGELFNALILLGVGNPLLANIKMTTFAAALLWSLRIAYRILNNLGLSGSSIILPLIPGALGSLTIGYAWWLAIF